MTEVGNEKRETGTDLQTDRHKDRYTDRQRGRKRGRGRVLFGVFQVESKRKQSKVELRIVKKKRIDVRKGAWMYPAVLYFA